MGLSDRLQEQTGRVPMPPFAGHSGNADEHATWRDTDRSCKLLG